MYNGCTRIPTPTSVKANAQIKMYDGRRRLGVDKMERMRSKLRMVVGMANRPFMTHRTISVV